TPVHYRDQVSDRATPLSGTQLLAVVGLATRARDALARPLVNRGVEGGTGVVMLGFAGALAAEG
ncbi:hypothetical protein, partial [Dermacoccus sp. 147Ba]|uniref:hypothetical protein n=1 Tax=Dermacoccus sp. 147Ba TaxID=2510111 RepID=UPI00351A792A